MTVPHSVCVGAPGRTIRAGSDAVSLRHPARKPITWQVPVGINSVTIEVWGAQGGANANATGSGGLGGYAIGTLDVVAGQDLFIYVGGQGQILSGGFNGGASGGATNSPNSRGGGGGYAGFQGLGGSQVAGGLGGTSNHNDIGGGNGLDGLFGLGGAGGFAPTNNQGSSDGGTNGGAGGGLSGLAGGSGTQQWRGGGGGGGSSFYANLLTGTSTTENLWSGNGFARLTYTFVPSAASVPLPAAAWAGLALLGGMGSARLLRRKRRRE